MRPSLQEDLKRLRLSGLALSLENSKVTSTDFLSGRGAG